MKAEYLRSDLYETIFHEMRPINADVLRFSLKTGQRIGDVLKIRCDDIRGDVLTIVAQKTSKTSCVDLSREDLLLLSRHRKQGNPYCFAGRKLGTHQTRQAVWADMRKACKLLSVPLHISPHSCRKTYAVGVFHRDGIEAVKEKLQHDNIATTLLYAFSDCNMQGGRADTEEIKDIAREAARAAFDEMKKELIYEIRTLLGL